MTKLDDRIGAAALQYSCQVLDTLSSYAKSNLYTVSGEWSNAVTDCAKWLNGRGVGARWDGTWQPDQPTFGSCDGYTGDMSSFSDDYKKFLRKSVCLSAIAPAISSVLMAVCNSLVYRPLPQVL